MGGGPSRSQWVMCGSRWGVSGRRFRGRATKRQKGGQIARRSPLGIPGLVTFIQMPRWLVVCGQTVAHHWAVGEVNCVHTREKQHACKQVAEVNSKQCRCTSWVIGIRRFGVRLVEVRGEFSSGKWGHRSGGGAQKKVNDNTDFVAVNRRERRSGGPIQAGIACQHRPRWHLY